MIDISGEIYLEVILLQNSIQQSRFQLSRNVQLHSRVAVLEYSLLFGVTEHFPVGSTFVQRQNIQAAYDSNIKIFLTCQTTDNIIKSLLEKEIEYPYLAGIHSAILGFGVRSLQDIFLHLYQSYGRIIPASFQVHITCLTTPIGSHLPIALIFRKIEECQRFAIQGGTAFTAEQLIKASETLIIATGKYQLA